MGLKLNSQLKEYVDSYPVDLQNQVYEYLDGKRNVFDTEFLEIPGTKFQQEVLREMTKIPYGETISYKKLAEKVGRPKAHRAVANVCGMNPYPIVIPCHRVVSSNGIGGFSLGLDMKKKFLKLELNK